MRFNNFAKKIRHIQYQGAKIQSQANKVVHLFATSL